MFLKFRYTNHRGEDHEYVVDPAQIILDGIKGWILEAEVVTRDGDTRDDMWPSRRRSFMLVEMREMEQVGRETLIGADEPEPEPTELDFAHGDPSEVIGDPEAYEAHTGEPGAGGTE